MTKLTVEVAKTAAQLAQGLMHRQTLAKNEGMLFQFPMSLEASFWGKNTYIPLDIAFVSNGVITGIKNITPLSTRTVRSEGLCEIAIEANAGFFSSNNIKVGDKIEMVSGSSGNIMEVLFQKK